MTQNTQCILTKLESKMHRRNCGKKWTDPSMSAKRKWRTYCHLSDGRKWRRGKAVEKEKVSTSNWNIYILWQYMYFIVRWNNCILRVVRHTHYIWVKNNQVTESLSTFFKENAFLSTDFYKYLFLSEAWASCNDTTIQNKFTN